MLGGNEEENFKFVQVRVPVGILDKIDKLVKEKQFSSRSEFFKRIAVEYIAGNNHSNFREILKDPEIRKEIRDIVKEQL
jgi:metal-responsive CopG/Arc/MetJ family transcriptional regulator